MDAPLLAEDLTPPDPATQKAPGVTGNRGGRHARQRVEGHRSRVLQALPEGAEPRAEHEQDLRPAEASRLELVGQALVQRAHRNMPATVAVIQEAKAPPSIARTAKPAIVERRSGARGVMPPIWIPTEAKLAKPHSA